jgi:hypothetical protein
VARSEFCSIFCPKAPVSWFAWLVHPMLAKEPLRRPLPSELIDPLAAMEIERFAARLWLP